MSRKAESRKIALERRRELPENLRHLADQAILAEAVKLAANKARIAAYVPLQGEPGGPGFVDALSAVADVLLPILLPDRDLDWARYDGELRAPLTATGGALLREPVGAPLGRDAIGAVDLILVPALGVDRAGIRLGRGGGSYDRALVRAPAGIPVVAIVYDGEIHDRLPAEEHDQAVTAVLSPAGLSAISMS